MQYLDFKEDYALRSIRNYIFSLEYNNYKHITKLRHFLVFFFTSLLLGYQYNNEFDIMHSVDFLKFLKCFLRKYFSMEGIQNPYV